MAKNSKAIWVRHKEQPWNNWKITNRWNYINFLKFKKEDKFDKKMYSLIYPSNCIPPRWYRTLKAHKPEKNYPIAAVVSVIGSPPYVTSKYFVIIQFWTEENNVISTNPFVLLATRSAYYPVRIIKPLYVNFFLLEAYFLQIPLKLTWANSNGQYLKIAMKQ